MEGTCSFLRMNNLQIDLIDVTELRLWLEQEFQLNDLQMSGAEEEVSISV